MARTAVAYSNLLPNANVADSALTAVTLNPGTNNGHRIASAEPERTVLRVAAGATGGNITIKAGANPPAIAASMGDLVVNVAANTIQWIGPFESGRFIQNDGSMLVDVAAAVVPGTITALRIPRGV
ncbi:hypothetical protein DMA15_17595 [Streptomyces sp. WAC 01529]|uniref:hypothetical protein n=1 Tax=Streptomyces sp. WAC 01529 TaxID=2203205 RepID=UPI000F7131B4|nr:hypothetical protein [Streptomyces sp. WAC 01529]AZM54160.1 hypothetical protein DMA15_17595 [Streptomyces sp. WAC 01529]